ncbi:hypothetical protein BK004_01470 [bacterium CG10_46_32]|nr:MAG: hypothetical protein BK004_01470 [bacterium CG10_46_32]PIR56366.1 MAG: hypothetical protein COU73_01485 [Parcubacteria group bacterium CG10_big_fil_rev_8_21_14_0_10_46_32]
MEKAREKRPIFIVGCTRSGTKLVSRIVGGHLDNFLITEHREKFHIPEDRSGVCEEHLWFNNFEFKHWGKNGDPLVRTPIYNKADIARMKEILLSLSGAKRLVVKNPQDILRIRFIKKMFPDALFVFCVRNPWHGLQSRIIGGEAKYLIPSEKNFELPDDLLLKSVYSWKESIDIYQNEHDENWCAIRYEDVVFSTKDTLAKLFEFLGMDSHSEYFNRACSLPRDLEHQYYPVKKAFKKSAFKKEIMDIVHDGCAVFPYETSIDLVPGSAWHYYLLEKDIINIKWLKARFIGITKCMSKSILRIVFYVVGGVRKTIVSHIMFAALSEGASAFVSTEDAKIADVAGHSKKDETASFIVSQMQYQRLRHFNRVIVLDSTGSSWLLLKNIDFFPEKQYNYILNGKVEYIKHA